MPPPAKQSVISPTFDFVEAVALMDRSRRRKRAPAGYLVLIELVLVGLCTAASITVGTGREYVPGLGEVGHPEDPWRLVAAGLLGGVAYVFSLPRLVSLVVCVGVGVVWCLGVAGWVELSADLRTPPPDGGCFYSCRIFQLAFSVFVCVEFCLYGC